MGNGWFLYKMTYVKDKLKLQLFLRQSLYLFTELEEKWMDFKPKFGGSSIFGDTYV